jgi:uncharacterized protein
MTHDPVIIVMAKAPRPGEAKTRLVPALSEGAAASLAACFVQDTVWKARQVVRHVIVAFTPLEGRAVFAPLVPTDVTWAEQKGNGLGDRLAGAVEEASARGFSPVLVVGTDCPTLPISCLETAVRLLDSGHADVVLGPTDDGGYYLVGLRQPSRSLFDNVPWSTPRAYAETANNARRAGLRLRPLRQWYDIDTPADLVRLRGELDADETTQSRAPATFRWLCAHNFPP